MKTLMALVVSLLFSRCLYAQAQFSLGASTGPGDAPDSLLGTWGTGTQCDAHRAGDTSSPSLLPYEITQEWIRQGFIYCYLSWNGHEKGNDAVTAYARAQCGEDNLRDYRLRLRHSAGRLQIRWSEDFTTAKLQHCD